MECTFVPGQKVICIDDTRMGCRLDWSAKSDRPRKGGIYTVVRVGPSVVPENNGAIVVWLAEIKHYCRRGGIEYWDCGYGAVRFRPVTSIDVFHRIRREAEKSVVEKV